MNIDYICSHSPVLYFMIHFIIGKMEIDKEVLALASGCPTNLSCITKSTEHLCKVEECLNNKIYFLNCSDNNTCNYKVSFGTSHTCACPVRKEIYNKYKV